MKKITLCAAIAALMAFPAVAETRYDYARVIESVPVYRTVQVSSPRETCWDEQVAVREHRGSRSNTPVIISTIVGGALGNAVGHGKSNRRVGAVVGAVLGHSVGRDIVRNSGPAQIRYETVERCEISRQTHEERELVGYQVRYAYHGEEYSVRMDHDPGSRIQVKVRVDPVR